MGKETHIKILVSQEDREIFRKIRDVYGLRSYRELVRCAILHLSAKQPDLVVEDGNVTKVIKPIENVE